MIAPPAAAPARRCWPASRIELGGLIGRGKPLGPTGPRRWPMASRRATAAGAESATRLSTWCRSAAGSTATGSAPSRLSGVSSRRRRAPQMAQRRMCRPTRLRSSTVSFPSQPVMMLASSAQACCPDRATSSTPSAASKCVRARDAMACAWLRGTPRVSARSAPVSSWPRVSSMISRSLSVRPASAAQTSSRISACSSPAPRSAVSSVTSADSSSGVAESRVRSCRWHSFRATAYSQGRSRSGSRSAPTFSAVMTNVSCTASAASAGSASST